MIWVQEGLIEKAIKPNNPKELMSRAPMFGVMLAGKLYGREPVMVIPAKTPWNKLMLYVINVTHYLCSTRQGCMSRRWRCVHSGRTRG